MEFTLSNVIALVFGDQYKTMAVYYTNAAGVKTLSEAIVLRDRYSGVSTPKYHKMRYDPTSDILSINEILTGIPSANDPGWRDFDFDVVNQANDVWLEDSSIIIGTGDIRGGAVTLFNYDLAAYDVIVTSFYKHSLKLHK